MLEDSVETLAPVMRADRLEALIGKLLDDQRRSLAVVFDAQDLLARFRHQISLSEAMTNVTPLGLPRMLR